MPKCVHAKGCPVELVLVVQHVPRRLELVRLNDEMHTLWVSPKRRLQKAVSRKAPSRIAKAVVGN